MSEIKPTPEEWARFRAERQRQDSEEWRAWQRDSLGMQVELLGWACNEVDRVGYTDFRLLAGKALFGRPFGFTWDDVVLVREAITTWDDEGNVRLANLADRIAALLPPREP